MNRSFPFLCVGFIAIGLCQGCKRPQQTVMDLIAHRGDPVTVARAAYLTDSGQPALRRLSLYGAVEFESFKSRGQSAPKSDCIYVFVKDAGAIRSLKTLGHFDSTAGQRMSVTWYTPDRLGRGAAEVFVIDRSGLVKDFAEVKWNVIESHESEGSPKGERQVNQWKTGSEGKSPPNDGTQ